MAGRWPDGDWVARGGLDSGAGCLFLGHSRDPSLLGLVKRRLRDAEDRVTSLGAAQGDMLPADPEVLPVARDPRLARNREADPDEAASPASVEPAQIRRCLPLPAARWSHEEIITSWTDR
jgi:hypothetical protein